MTHPSDGSQEKTTASGIEPTTTNWERKGGYREIGTGIYIGKKQQFEGLLQNFKNVALFEIVVRTGISLQKNSDFIFWYYFYVTPCQVLL